MKNEDKTDFNDAFESLDQKLQSPVYKSDITPDPRVLGRLKQKMRDGVDRSTIFETLLQKRIPAYATLLLMAVSSMTGLMFMKTTPSQSITKTIVKSDTVYISKTDTVFRDHIIYRRARLTTSVPDFQFTNKAEKESAVTNGVSMKDKEELNKLLVSGSD